MTAPQPLRLRAFDTEDLSVLAACLQDALVAARDMRYLPDERRFAMVLRRFCWECGGGAENWWVACGLHFDGVDRAQTAAFPQDDNQPLELLTLRFMPSDAPAGQVELLFSGGAAIRLSVECLDAHLSDLGPPEAVSLRPRHVLDDGAGKGMK